MSDHIKQPPLGLCPELFHKEQRFEEVYAAIYRYWHAQLVIPVEWITEYNELLTWLKVKHFKTEYSLLEWVNGNAKFRIGDIISIIKDVTNGDFIIFYCA